MSLFRRSKTAEAAPTVEVREGGKGRPTPTRREAEAARKARVKLPADKKEAAKLLKQRRYDSNAKMRQGMKTGDERYLPARDKGPVRRFVRDWIDARLCIGELLLPLLLLSFVTTAIFPNSGSFLSIIILLVAVDTSLLIFTLRRQLRRRFPVQSGHQSGHQSGQHSTKGAVPYAVFRSLQLRWLRLPKAQVKLGAKLPDRY